RFGQVETLDVLQREYVLTAQAIGAAARELL
ncbi:transketolase, partial [Escherichia coli]